MRTRTLQAWLLLGLTGLGHHAASATEPCVHIHGGTVFDGERLIEDADVLIRGRVIVEVGAVKGSCATVIDADGGVITPGLVEGWTKLGLVEIGAVKKSVDTDHSAPLVGASYAKEVRASVDAALAFNARSTLLPIARTGGITSAVAAPSGGTISGTGLFADLVTGPRSDALVAERALMVADVRGREASRATAFHTLKVALEEARLRAKRAAADGPRGPWLTSAVDANALADVTSGRMPLVVRVDRAADIEALLSVAKGLRLVIVGAAEGWLVREQLAAADVAVIVNPLTNAPSSFDSLHARADNAALLASAGVRVILTTGSSHSARKLRQVAGNAVRAGMSYPAALRAITATPAEVFGGKERRGVLKAGAVANVAVWSADPLEMSTTLQHVLIGGKSLPLVSRQTELLKRYRRLPAGAFVPPPAATMHEGGDKEAPAAPEGPDPG